MGVNEQENKEQTEQREKPEVGENEKQKQTEEPKVKQVTFKETTDVCKEKSPKKVRTRKKAIMNKLKTQMEFYFGDSNLSKDRFMNRQIESDPEGYVPLSVFMDFGLIKALTTDVNLLIKALRLSQVLQVNADETKVRRTTPVKLMSQEEIDIRTVYVEGFHKFTSRDWIMSKFSKCGKVNYISIPRFKTTKEIKGYAFVEFETPEEAQKAIRKLNRVPDMMDEPIEEQISGSIKQCKNLTHWKKRASKEGIDVAALDAKLKEERRQADGGPKEGTKSKSKRKKKKPRQNVQSEGTTQGGSSLEKTAVTKDELKENTSKVSSETDEAKVKKSKRSKKKHKRKASLNWQISNEEPTTADTQENGDSKGTVLKSEASEKSADMELKVSEMPEESSNAAEMIRIAKDASGRTLRVKLVHNYSNVSGSKVGTEMIKTDVTGESSESECQSSRKRPRPQEATSDVCPAKVSKVGPDDDQDSKVDKNEEKEGCANDRNNQKVPDVSTVPTSGDECSKDPESQNVSSRKRKRRASKDDDDNTQQSRNQQPQQVMISANNENSGIVKPTTSTGDDLAKQVEQQQSSSKKKKKESRLAGQMRRSMDQAPELITGKGKKRKRKSLEGGDEGSSRKKKKADGGSATEDAADGEEQTGKKKRRRRHKVPEPFMRLKVMTKAKWEQLKSDYLGQQKIKMRQLKDYLRETAQKKKEEKQNQQNNGQDENVADSKGRPAPEFVPNVILAVKSDVGMCLHTIKGDMAPSIQVAYYDIKPGMTEGYIRCKNEESAAKLMKTGVRGLSLSRVEGEAELQYWNKVMTDRQAKLSDTTKRKRRGKLKILQRAQIPEEDTTRRQHLKFHDDENGENENGSDKPGRMEDEFNAYSYHSPPSPTYYDGFHNYHKQHYSPEEYDGCDDSSYPSYY